MLYLPSWCKGILYSSLEKKRITRTTTLFFLTQTLLQLFIHNIFVQRIMDLLASKCGQFELIVRSKS